jgi:Cation efflux family
VTSKPFLDPMARAARGAGSASLTTILIAFAANLLVAVAKSVAAVVTGSASILAEAAHSWADTGNEVFLVIANRRSRRPPTACIRSATAARRTSGRSSQRSACSSPAPRSR